MIGSHNSFTFKKSTNSLFNLFSGCWKCQNKTLTQQYEAGVRFFDLRVFRKDDTHWGLAHGLVNLSGGYDTITTLLMIMHSSFPEAYFRVILEKGSSDDKKLFKDEIADAIVDLKGVTKIYQAIIKSNWEIVYSSNKEFIMKDYCYTPVLSGKSFWYNLTHIKLSTIKKWAKKHNPEITQELIDDPVVVHFMDFI